MEAGQLKMETWLFPPFICRQSSGKTEATSEACVGSVLWQQTSSEGVGGVSFRPQTLSVGVKIQQWPLAAKPAVNICGAGVTPEILMGLFRGYVSFQ